MCDVANRINARHASGAPSNNFAAAGVAVHQQPAKDILGFSNLQNHGDRVSASVMNSAWPHLFVRELPGVVVAPRVAATMLNCAFGTDGYTSGRYNCAPGQRNCLPGCYTSGGCSNSHPGWHPAGGGSGLSGIRELHHDFARLKKETKEAGKELVSSTVIGAPLHTLAQLAGLKKINFLSIDVEGAEVAILKAFDFKALPVDVVMVECSYRAEQLQGLMDQKGFLRQARAHGDYVFLSRRATGVCGAPAPTRGGRPPGVARTYTRPEPKEVEEIDF